jgi:hypothetical protein
MAGMRAGLEVVFIAMPRTDDMSVVWMVFHGANSSIACNRLHDAFHNHTLAYRATAVGASIVPGMELSIDLEDADFGVATPDQSALALFELFESAGVIIHHLAVSQN